MTAVPATSQHATGVLQPRLGVSFPGGSGVYTVCVSSSLNVLSGISSAIPDDLSRTDYEKLYLNGELHGT